MSKVDETKNLLQLYLHHVGVSQVPRQFHLWSCLSLIASCVTDRVTFEKFKGKPIPPNIYVMLIGPSGVGKGEAIGQLLKFVPHLEPNVRVWLGKVTGPSLLDVLSNSDKVDPTPSSDYSKLTIVHPELYMAARGGPEGEQLISHMTELYSGSPIPIRDYTRTHGVFEIKGHCINWLAGTTMDWLKKSVSSEAVEGGFFGRVITVRADYDYTKRILDPAYPEDRHEVEAYLIERFQELTRVEGACELDEGAQEVRKQWFEERPAPEDELWEPTWHRDDDTILKVAMLASLTDGYDLVIRRQHMRLAQQLVAEARTVLPDIVSAVSSDKKMSNFYRVADTIRKHGQISHSRLSSQMRRRGMTAGDVREFVSQLRASGDVSVGKTSMGTVVYRWNVRDRAGIMNQGEE